MNFETLQARIKQILYDYVKIPSFTGTAAERSVEGFLTELISNIPYFADNPAHWGLFPVEKDGLGRNIVWAMVRGKGNRTVVLLHHYDVVDIEDYKTLKKLAFSPDELHEALKKQPQLLTEEAHADLQSGEFLFCHGGCDMKAGGAIQFALLEQYSKEAAGMNGGVFESADPELVGFNQRYSGPDISETDESGTGFAGNVILLAVPDEENLSAGMRSAVKLLAQLKEQFDLEYVMTINSEPHQRRSPVTCSIAEGNSSDGTGAARQQKCSDKLSCRGAAMKGVFSEGTVGKLMPFVYVRGSMSHAGKVFEGFNPTGLLAEIVTRTELNLDFIDANGTEASPPPTWLSMKDSKTHYDVSMPQTAYGCFSVLTLRQTPEDVLYKVRKICEEAFRHTICRMNDRYLEFCKRRGQIQSTLSWNVKVLDFRELYSEAEAAGGETFRKAYRDSRAKVLAELKSGAINMIQGNERLLATLCDFVEDAGPYVVYGLLPPYYPAGCNARFAAAEVGAADIVLKPDEDRAIKMPSFAPATTDVTAAGSAAIDATAVGLCTKLMSFTERQFGEVYEQENYFTGICDLSYINIADPSAHRKSMERAMPLWGDYYSIPFEEIEKIAMAGINIGPWGKDFHKLSERVSVQDLYERTPRILDYAVRTLLENRE